MWRPRLPFSSRRLSEKGRDTLSRIIKFESSEASDSNPLLGGRSEEYVASSVANDTREDYNDYDSCWSPTVALERSLGIPRLSLRNLSSAIGARRRSASAEDLHDFDSCISPVSTARWTPTQLDEFKRTESDCPFDELYELLVEGYITHFSAHRGEKGNKILEICPDIPPKAVIVSGSFNPLHHGHEHLAKKAVEQAPGACGAKFFEISTVNVDKGPLSSLEMERRVDNIIKRGHACLLTSALLFDAKADLFPKCIFAIGYDTYIRVVNPRYYPRVTGGLDATLSRIEAKGCEFFVGGRLTNGIYHALAPSPKTRSSSNVEDSMMDLQFDAVELPNERRRMFCKEEPSTSQISCEEEPMTPLFSGIREFRFDISSTEIREGKHLIHFALEDG
ncbi:hypothetical protein C9890_0103 [Perkinsus sp. BL_2016]|nr:hypothetical protein C9890_0103 [Perkinsus sp. BL_2016]